MVDPLRPTTGATGVLYTHRYYIVVMQYAQPEVVRPGQLHLHVNIQVVDGN